VVSVTVVLWNRSFVGLWIGPDQYVGDLQTLLIVTMLLQLSMIRNDAFIIDLTLEMRAKVLLGLLSACVSLLLAAYLVGAVDAGISGLCIGIIVGRSVLTVAYPRLTGAAVGHPLVAQARSAVRPVLTSVVLLAGTLALGHGFSTQRWAVLVAGALATAAALAPVVALVGLRPDQRGALVARAGEITRRR